MLCHFGGFRFALPTLRRTIKILVYQTFFRLKKFKWCWKWCWILTISFFSTSCGPIYDTKYSLTPPSTSEGKTCISQCDNARLQCEQMERLNETVCELRNSICEGKLDCFGFSHFCLANYSRCDKHYVNCYQTCGGKVESKKVCVMGCN
jgi:hypothetical protein